MIILEDKPLLNVHGFERDDPGGNYQSRGRLFQIGDLDGLDGDDVLLITSQQESDEDADIPFRSRKTTLQDSDVTEVGESREVEEGASGDRSRPRFDRSRLSLNLLSDQEAPPLNQHLLSFYRELDEEISSFESEFDDGVEGYSSSSHSLNHSRSLTPETEAARILMAIGDDIERRYHSDLTRAARYIVSDLISGMFTYEQFREAASAVLEHDLEGWQQVAAVMLYSQHVTMQMVQTGLRGLNFVVDCTVRLLAEKAAGFIIRQGGWAGIHPSGYSATSSSSEETKPLIHAVIDSILPTQTARVDKPQTDETDFPDGINTAPVEGHQLQEAEPLDIPNSGNRRDPSPDSSEHQQAFFEAISRPVDGGFNVPETNLGGESVKEIMPADPAMTAEGIHGNAAQGVDTENSKPPTLSEPLMHSHLLPVCAGFVSFAAIGTAIMLNLFRN
ncbi:hypothetical protein C0Q70_10910 [Pomacea canaliculata]|uniref:Bcl-2 Bcl-2 homology region 1-3 domain-containing protein n=1 Tax=Pomacea canaliculata TaxID=400727 RepID=A0A2T7P4J5_POMCA|nr:hypothetical protein C0Q70_10910 [Pomacea canaliculata]